MACTLKSNKTSSVCLLEDFCGLLFAASGFLLVSPWDVINVAVHRVRIVVHHPGVGLVLPHLEDGLRQCVRHLLQPVLNESSLKTSECKEFHRMLTGGGRGGGGQQVTPKHPTPAAYLTPRGV